MKVFGLTMLLPTTTETPERKRFTREEVERLLSTGVFDGQRYELIDGDLIDKMGQKPPHASAIRRVSKWLRTFLPDECVQVQLPIELNGEDRERSIPEPDVAVVAELKPEHERRHPRGNELLLIVEIADTSVVIDLGRKAVIYATSGVPEYWVPDLNRRMLVVHRQSDGTQYRRIHLFSEDEVAGMEGRQETVQVRNILPESVGI